MILICDWCQIVTVRIVKIPSSDFYVQDKTLHTINSYVNICIDCLLNGMERNEI